MQFFINEGVDGIITNYPDKLNKILKEKIKEV
jgi:glycerophosphoryl diester phosphodiesterase